MSGPHFAMPRVLYGSRPYIERKSCTRSESLIPPIGIREREDKRVIRLFYGSPDNCYRVPIFPIPKPRRSSLLSVVTVSSSIHIRYKNHNRYRSYCSVGGVLFPSRVFELGAFSRIPNWSICCTGYFKMTTAQFVMVSVNWSLDFFTLLFVKPYLTF